MIRFALCVSLQSLTQCKHAHAQTLTYTHTHARVLKRGVVLR